MLEDLEDMFPGLAISGYEITSEASGIYNCIAWAAGDNTVWWDWHPRVYWPEFAPGSPEVEALVQVFADLGYSICDNAELEAGYEKVAVYAINGRWEHAARQLENGQWTSKLGEFEDITHPSPQDLTGELYGSVHCIMRRPSA